MQLQTEYGVTHLTLSQLFLLILGDTPKNRLIVQQLAEMSADFTQITYLTAANLLAIDGIGKIQCQRILAVVELAQSLHKQQLLKSGTTYSNKLLAEHLLVKLGKQQQELLLGLFFNHNNELLLEQVIFQGTLCHAAVHPREIIQRALQIPCTSIVLAHNHPSGQINPSNADITFTQRVQACANLFEIKLIDHLIIGRNDFFSLSSHGLL